jgi:hypothetical protein
VDVLSYKMVCVSVISDTVSLGGTKGIVFDCIILNL